MWDARCSHAEDVTLPLTLGAGVRGACAACAKDGEAQQRQGREPALQSHAGSRAAACACERVPRSQPGGLPVGSLRGRGRRRGRGARCMLVFRQQCHCGETERHYICRQASGTTVSLWRSRSVWRSRRWSWRLWRLSHVFIYIYVSTLSECNIYSM